MAKQRKMVNLAVDETSGVDHPAHLQEGWIVLKNAEASDVLEKISEQVDPEGNEEPVSEEVQENAAEASELEKAQARIAELEEALAKATAPAEDNSEEALIKSAPAPVREMLEKARKEAEAVREELHKERMAQRDREFVAKAAGFEFLSLDPNEFGPMWRQIADMNSDLAGHIEKALASANAQAESSAIFTELGTNKSATGVKAYDKVQTLAKAAVAAGEFPTVEQAVVGLIAKDPALYNEYLSEQQA
jgi:hypothetical protein